MNEDRARRVERLFQEAADLSGPERGAFLDAQTGDDPSLRREVEELLLHLDSARSSFLASPIGDVAQTPPFPEAVSEAMPDAIGRYPVLDELGRGGMGVVYRGRDPQLLREVAIKVLPARLAADPEWQSRFQREAQLLASIQHPNIATVFSLETAAGCFFLTMELVRGEHLTRRINGAPMSLEDALSVCQQIAAALEAAHLQGVVHRDLKPLNVMVTPEDRVKVLDFGLAKTVAAEAELSLQQVVAGTPGYMSPEQLRGEDVDTRADVWAFGCILFECLTGQPAFGGRSVADRVAGTLHGEPDWELLPPRVPDALREILRRMLRKDRAERLESIRFARREIEEQIALGVRSTLPAQTHRAVAGPNNLPTPLTRFVGRSDEVRVLTELAADRRVLSIVGPGGVGKSRLALEVARALLPATPEGAWLVELSSIADPRAVEGVVAAAIGMREQSGVPRREAIRKFLDGKRLLIVLDTCEHLLSVVAPLVLELCQSSEDLRVIATTREPLGLPGEVVYRVPPMSDGAVELFLERARAANPELPWSEEQRPTIEAICRKLDGIPLAIELAAARARVLSLAEIAARLDDRFQLLKSGSMTTDPRHRTLRALIDWSYDQLESTERIFFSRLSTFACGFTLEAAEAVCAGGAIDAWETLDLLSRLVDKSLVEMIGAGSPGARVRYRMLDTVRAYAQEVLDEGPAVEDRYLQFYSRFAADAATGLGGPEQVTWLERIHADYENMRRAIEVGLARKPLPTVVLDIMGAMMLFGVMRGRWAGPRRLGEQVLARVESEPMPRNASLGFLYHRLGNLAQNQGDAEPALRWFEVAARIWEELGDRRNLAGILNNRGLLSQRAGDYETAKELFRKALAINREIGNRDWESTNVNNLALCAMEQGDKDTAYQYYAEAVRIGRESGNAYYLAMFLDNLAIATAAIDDERLEEAARLHAEALELHRKVGNERGVATTLLNLGSVLGDMGKVEEGHASVAESLAIKHRIGDRRGVLFALESLAAVQTRIGRPERAVRLLAAAAGFREALEMPLGRGERGVRDRNLERARQQLSEPESEVAWAEGQAFSMDDAVRYALEDTDFRL